LLDVNFITKYYGKVLEIEKIKTSNMQQDMLNKLDQMKNEEEKKSLEVLRETAEIEKATQTILTVYERTDKLRDARRVLSQANSLKSGIDIVNFYNFLSKVLPRNDKVSKDIEKIVFNSLDSPDLFREIVDKIIELEKDDMTNDELENLLNELVRIVRDDERDDRGDNPPSEAGQVNDENFGRRVGGKRKTHKKSSKSKKSKKHNKKHHKKTAHKKRGSRRK